MAETAKFRDLATFDQVVRLLERDIEIAQSVAGNIEAFSGRDDVDMDKLIAILAQHSDPAVAGSLASNGRAPKKVLKALLKHADPCVANCAKARLA